MTKNIVITVDGPSASGKGTICSLLSKHFNIPHLNTGGLYRGLAYKASQLNLDLYNEVEMTELAKTLTEKDINNPIIFTEEVAQKASIVAKIQSVRDVLFQYQVDFSKQDGGAILDGRDIGTVVCPNADYKFFVIASPEERANRRFKEMKEKGQDVNYDEILNQIKNRDEQDKNRTVSPFKQAEDAILIDTTGKTIQEVFDEVLSHINIKD